MLVLVYAMIVAIGLIVTFVLVNVVYVFWCAVHHYGVLGESPHPEMLDS